MQGIIAHAQAFLDARVVLAARIQSNSILIGTGASLEQPGPLARKLKHSQ